MSLSLFLSLSCVIDYLFILYKRTFAKAHSYANSYVMNRREDWIDVKCHGKIKWSTVRVYQLFAFEKTVAHSTNNADATGRRTFFRCQARCVNTRMHDDSCKIFFLGLSSRSARARWSPHYVHECRHAAGTRALSLFASLRHTRAELVASSNWNSFCAERRDLSTSSSEISVESRPRWKSGMKNEARGEILFASNNKYDKSARFQKQDLFDASLSPR